jgi:multiple sugar transport system substrate-binding protein
MEMTSATVRWVRTLGVGSALAFALGNSAVLAAEACKEVRVLVTAGPEEDYLIKHAQSEFEKQTGIQASIETVSRDLWSTREVREFTGDSPSYDVVGISAGAGDPLWVGRGKSADLSKLLPADTVANILPSLKSATTVDGKLVAVAQYWNTQMYFYRKDLFEDPKEQAAFKAKYGYDLAPPTTWDQLVDIDNFFHRPPDLYGGWMSGVNWGVGLDYQAVLFGVGGDVSDLGANEMLLNSPESVKALSIMQAIGKTAPESFTTQSFFDADTLMQGGKLATYTNWAYIWGALSKTPGKYGMAPLPSKSVPIGTFLFAVPRGAAHLDCAKKFLTWMLSDAYQIKQAPAIAAMPSTTSAFGNADVKAGVNGYDALAANVTKLKPLQVTWGPELFDGIAQAGADLYSGAKTPQQAADWLENTKFKDRKPVE